MYIGGLSLQRCADCLLSSCACFVVFLQAYYGGEAVCAEAASDDYDPKELVCGGCSDVTAAQVSVECEGSDGCGV